MAIYMDKPRPRGDFALTAHLISDVPGEEGTRELRAFAQRLGIADRALHHPDTAKEHYDLINGKTHACENAGVPVIDSRDLIHIIRRKRAAALAHYSKTEDPQHAVAALHVARD